MTTLTVTGLTKSYGRTRVLRGVDLVVPQGSLTAILGPSGCGKTTLLRLVAGFADPDAGTIALDDRVVYRPGHSTPPQHRGIGYVPQEGALFPHLTVAANVAFGLTGGRRRDPARIARLLHLVGLPAGLTSRYPHELSGGQQQRVALARALAPEPALVLLDEPFSSLDAALRDGTRRAVAAALRAAGATAVLVTHDQSEALSLADQIGVMRDGRLAQLDNPVTVYTRPADTDTAAFVGEAILLPAAVRDGHASCALGALPVAGPATPGPAMALIRPEQLVLHPDATAGVPATVTDITYYGHDTAVHLVLAPDGPAITARIGGQALPLRGMAVGVTVSGPVTTYPGREPRPPADAVAG
ncbi:MAG TPA: ABC transporter ATP-binding protein [Actinoplanes sp.]|nr:ABC transporter ATP-binding protein [Actinoplanes sp.]